MKEEVAPKTPELQEEVTSPVENINEPGVTPAEVGLLKKPIFWILVLITFLVAVLSIGVVGVFAVAYQGLSFRNKAMDNFATGLVMNLPFVPKTPRYVLSVVAKNFQSVSKIAIDATLSYEAEKAEIALGENKFVAEVGGFIDYSDNLKPKFQITSSVNKELVFQVRKPDESQIYFKLDKVPESWAKTFLGSTNDLSGVIPYWVNYDLTPFLIDSSGKNQGSEANKDIRRRIFVFDDPRVRSAITISEATEEGRRIYRLVFKPDDNLADYFFDKLGDIKTGSLKQSKTIKNFQISVSVDRERLLISRITVSSEYLTPSKSFLMNQYLNIITQENGQASASGGWEQTIKASQSGEPIRLAGSKADTTKTFIKLDLRFKDFNKSVPIEVPKNAISFEEYWKKIVETSATLKKSLQLSNDTRRRADLQRLQQSLQELLENSKGWPELEAKVPKNKLFELSSKNSFGLAVCKVLVPKYTPQIPFDTSVGKWKSCDEFHSGYGLMVGSYRTGEMPKITLTAVGELKKSIVNTE